MSPLEARHSLEGDIGGVVKLTLRREGAADVEVSIVRRSFLDTYLLAAMGGDPRAEFGVGHFYEHGPASVRDLPKAAQWYRKAADQGYAPAQANLAYMLRHGTGIPKDMVAAAAWDIKAASQGDAVAESGLAFSYLEGEGVDQSDSNAFAWFYSAAKQDDPPAEQYLGFLYRRGRGVVQNDQAAFDWYYRSAQRGDFYGEWGLAYMYERGRGVPPNIGEALKWYQKAQAGLPQNENLRKAVALASLRAFLETRDFKTLDLSLMTSAFRWEIFYGFLLLTAVYVAGGIVLFYFSLNAPDAPPGLPVAMGWLVFYIESQFVALLAVFGLGKFLTADILVIAMAVFGALPVIASSCGPNRSRIWKASPLSWKTLALYGAGSYATIFSIGFGYEKIYALIAHSPLPPQPTQALFIKATHGSVWLVYASLAWALPVAEEIIFRSYLFDALRRRFSGNIVVLITALVFALVHFQWTYFAPLFGFGLVLGWVRLRTASLRLPVLLHAINNSLSLAFAV
jgi:membrane protease YdiL (CAAX protease family)